MARTERCFLVKKYQNGCVIFFYKTCFYPTFSRFVFLFRHFFKNRKTPGISAGGRR